MVSVKLKLDITFSISSITTHNKHKMENQNWLLEEEVVTCNLIENPPTLYPVFSNSLKCHMDQENAF